MDRRIHKTREAILKAFVELIAEKNFEQITINEIAERADINRGTIYLHYTDKYDLLDQCIETHLTQLFESCLGDDLIRTPSRTSALSVLEYLQQHSSLYTTLLVNKGVPAFRNRLMGLLLDNINEQIDMNPIYKDMNKEVAAQFLVSATVGVLEWWITHSMPYSAQDMVEQLWSLLELMLLVPRAHEPLQAI